MCKACTRTVWAGFQNKRSANFAKRGGEPGLAFAAQQAFERHPMVGGNKPGHGIVLTLPAGVSHRHRLGSDSIGSSMLLRGGWRC